MENSEEKTRANAPEHDEHRLMLLREAARANEGWPWIGAPEMLLTQAPFAVNEYNRGIGYFILEEAMQV